MSQSDAVLTTPSYSSPDYCWHEMVLINKFDLDNPQTQQINKKLFYDEYMARQIVKKYRETVQRTLSLAWDQTPYLRPPCYVYTRHRTTLKVCFQYIANIWF